MHFFASNADKTMDLVTLASTALIMLVAGYDTTGQTLGYVGYILATRQDIQDKLLEEIDKATEESGGKMPSYSAVQEMEYLDMVIHETLRRYSPIGMIQRVCTEDYVLPGYPKIQIKKNTEVHCNAAAMHLNSKFYPDPLEIIPERFSKEEKSKRHP
jgi:cytochrome P450 family 6